MTLDSQLRLCRAGMIIGAFLCVAAVLQVSVGLLGLFSDFDAADRERSRILSLPAASPVR
jgi:hypothetical protein